MNNKSNNVRYVEGLLEFAIDSLAQFPSGYVPDQSVYDELCPQDGTLGIRDILSRSGAMARINKITEAWPKSFHSAFLQCGELLGRCFQSYGVLKPISILEAFEFGIHHPKLMNMAAMAADLPEGFLQDSAYQHLIEAVRVFYTPFGKTIVTLLGRNAFNWLVAPSELNVPRLQAHEFSRDGWANFDEIADQVEIEEDLVYLGNSNQENAKIIVATSWTMVALASFMEPTIFVGEHHPYLSSVRPSQGTVSYGRGINLITSFDTDSMRHTVEVLRHGLGEAEITAADLMWMATGVAKVCNREQAGFRIGDTRPSYQVFLSHRGQDSKRKLTNSVQRMQYRNGVFLDCLALPKGQVNRKFVFESLARSKQIFVVDSPNYDSSSWCRKERWFAEVMQRLELTTLSRVSTIKATECLCSLDEIPSANRTDFTYEYLIAPRILRDQERHRKTDRQELANQESSADLLAPVESLLNSDARLEAESICEAVDLTFQRLEKHFGDTISVETCCVVMQYLLAAFAGGSRALSKEAVRRSVDQMNDSVRDIVYRRIADHPHFLQHRPEYLALICGAVLVDLAGASLDSISRDAMKQSIGDTAILKDDFFLIDVRQSDALRELNLRLIVSLVLSNIGSIGIVQNAADPVHNQEVDDQDLSVLPCVTLHPGMEGFV